MEINHYNKDQAVESLQKLALGWISTDPRRTKTALARAADVSESSIRRLLNDGVLPSNENLFKLAAILNPRIQSKGDFNAESNSLEFTLPFLAFQENSDIRPWTELAPKLNSQLKKLIFSRASTGKVAEDEISRDFGQLGLSEAKCLVNDGLLDFFNGSFNVKSGLENVFFDSSATKEITSIAHQIYYKPQCSINYSMLLAEGVDKQGYREVIIAFSAFHREITKIVKSNPGEIPLIAAGFMDSMTTTSVFEEGGSNE